jgi:ribosomal protein S18 acetylase RimI-like enzyme
MDPGEGLLMQGEGFELRPAGEGELEVLLELYRQCEDFLALGPQPHASREMVLADLALSRRNGGLFYGIYTPDGGLAGVLDVIFAGYQGVPEHAYLELLMIAAAERGKGLGTRVLAWLEERLVASGIQALLAGVQVNNPGAIRFWTGHGFKITSEPRDIGDGTTAVDLEKCLVQG